MKPMMSRDTASFPVRKVGSAGPEAVDDEVAVERPRGRTEYTVVAIEY